MHEDRLFGIRLFNEGIMYLYRGDKRVLTTTEYHYRRIVKRGERAVSEARALLEKVESGTEGIDILGKFEFPPIHGLGLDEMTERAALLVDSYQRLFPNRPRGKPLTPEENQELMDEAMKNWPGE